MQSGSYCFLNIELNRYTPNDQSLRASYLHSRLIFAFPQFSVHDRVAASMAFSTDTAKALRCMVTDAAIVLARLTILTSVADTIVVTRARHRRTCAPTACCLARPISFLLWVAEIRLEGGGLAAKPNTIPRVGAIVERPKVIVLTFSVVKRVWEGH
jgi:hypothetical protein